MFNFKIEICQLRPHFTHSLCFIGMQIAPAKNSNKFLLSRIKESQLKHESSSFFVINDLVLLVKKKFFRSQTCASDICVVKMLEKKKFGKVGVCYLANSFYPVLLSETDKAKRVDSKLNFEWKF